MAFTTTQMLEHDLFVRAINTHIPAAKVWTEVRGWGDPRPQFVIRFKNDVQFESDTKHTGINDAKAYYETVKAFTGESP